MDKTIAALVLIAITVAAGFIVYGNFNQLATTVSTTSSTLIDAQASMAQDSEQTLLIINVQNTGGKPITDVTAQFRDSSGRTYTWKVFNGTLQPGRSAANKLAVTRINFIKGGQLPSGVNVFWKVNVGSKLYAEYNWQVCAFSIPDMQLAASYNEPPVPPGVYVRSTVGVVEANGKPYFITFDSIQGGSYINVWNLEAQSLLASIPSSSTVADATYGNGAIFMVEQSGRLIRVGLDGSVSAASLGETLQRIIYASGKLLICGSSSVYAVDSSSLSTVNKYSVEGGILQPVKQAYYIEQGAALNVGSYPSASSGDPWSILPAGWLQADAQLPCYTVSGKEAQRWLVRQMSTSDIKSIISPWIPSNWHGVVFYDPSQTPRLDYSNFIWFYKARVGVLDLGSGTWWSISFTPTGFYRGNSYTITVTATAADGSQCTRTVTATVQ